VTIFYVVRHGETDWCIARERRLKGAAFDLIPLTPLGIQQIEQTVELLRPKDVQLILSSPMTRTLQSAAVASRALDLPLAVEFDLHEWVPDLTYSWESAEEVTAAHDECLRLGGEWPPGEQRGWEPHSGVRRRVLAALERYGHVERVAVFSHGVVMYSLLGRWCELGELRELRL
jgi:broad specificity phosphatase PhoE